MAKKAAATPPATPPAFKPVVIPVKRGWLATDANGDVWWYKDKPVFSDGYWSANGVNRITELFHGNEISKRASEASLVEIKKASKFELRLVTE